MQRAVITGLGTISALGNNADEFWQSLIAGRCAIDVLPAMQDITIGIGARIADYDDSQYFTREDLGLLDRHSQYAIIAAREAVADAGLGVDDIDISEAAVILGTGCGGKCTDEETYDTLYKRGRKRVHPLTIPRGMPSAGASMVSKFLHTNGPAFVISTACASGAHATAQAVSMIRSGMADVVITGGADAPFTYGLMKAWEALKITSNDTCRPFSKKRSGIVLGEGAGMMVIESERHARQRGARVYAEVSGIGMSSDAGHITRPDLTGITAAMENAIRDAGIDSNNIDYINAHGTGTVLNDITETLGIKQVFGSHAFELAVSATKSMHGHALGASSAMELIATTLALYHNIIPPTVNFTDPDEECDLDYVPNHARQAVLDAAMSNSFAFGGCNAVIVLQSSSD